MSIRDPRWWHPARTGPVKNKGKDNAVAFAGSQRNFELNAIRPFIINNFLHSARILGEICQKLRHFSVEATRLDHHRI